MGKAQATHLLRMRERSPRREGRRMSPDISTQAQRVAVLREAALFTAILVVAAVCASPEFWHALVAAIAKAIGKE